MSNESQTLCGPGELLAVLLQSRDAGRRAKPEIYGAISDEGVRQLVLLSYFASQSAEEGRYPRFRLFVSPSANLPPSLTDPWQLLKFGHPIDLAEVDDLRRLAPCAASHDLALEVHERNDGGQTTMSCVGVRLAHSGEGGAEVLSTSLWARHVRPGLMVRVDGPGELRVSEAGRALDLRAGKLVNMGSLPTHPLPGWLDPLARKLAAKDRHEKHINHAAHFAWNELLHSSSEQGRGACLVVLPEAGLTADQVEADYSIRLKYPTSGPGLGRAISDFVASCLTPTAGRSPDEFRNAANSWLRNRYALSSLVDSLARLSGVDGCTVFDADLDLVGFGGKILTSASEGRRVRDFRANKWISPDVMNKTGTRHSSAYRLCQAKEGVWCYVVSQDGHVTAFWSDKDHVNVWKPYWPWAKRSDHF